MSKTFVFFASGFAMMLIGFMGGSPAADAQQERFSGPQPGESLSPFEVLMVSTPFDSQEVEIATGKQPLLLVFAHKVSEPAIGLMMSLEWYASKQKNLEHQYVFLSDDRAEMELRMKRWTQLLSKAHMSVSLDGPEGPGSYGLNRNVDMTVLVAKGGRVLNNFALLGPNNTDAPRILAALAQALGQEAPSYDEIRAEMRAERDRQRAARRREHPAFKLAPAPDLGTLMVSMLFGERITEEHVLEVSGKMVKWAGDNTEKKAALAKYAKAVLAGNFEFNRYAREALERISKSEG